MRSYGNGGSGIVTRAYDQAFHLTGLTVGPDGGPLVLDCSYVWGDGQNLPSWSGGARTTTASYDNLSRLTSFDDTDGDDFGYTFDDIVNRLGETVGGGKPETWTHRYQTNGAAGNIGLLLALAETESGSYLPAVHDDDGNLSFLGKGGLMPGYTPTNHLGWHAEAGAARRMTCDAPGYLVRLEADDASSEFADLRLVYDHRGRLLALIHDATHASLDRAYVWLEGQPLAEIVPGFTPPVWWVVGDHLGTPVIQYASATRYAEPWFDPYGKLTSKLETGGASPPLDLRFPGQLDLSLPGDEWPMHYNVHRWYLAGVGAYGQADAMGILRRSSRRSSGFLSTPSASFMHLLGVRPNLYAYGLANPLALSDPLGLDVHNGGTGPICVKPEDGPGPVVIQPGGTYDDPVDGVSTSDGRVFKITDPYNDSDIEVGDSGVDLPGPDAINRLLGGGFLSCPPDNDWKPIFECAGGSS